MTYLVVVKVRMDGTIQSKNESKDDKMVNNRHKRVKL